MSNGSSESSKETPHMGTVQILKDRHKEQNKNGRSSTNAEKKWEPCGAHNPICLLEPAPPSGSPLMMRCVFLFFTEDSAFQYSQRSTANCQQRPMCCFTGDKLPMDASIAKTLQCVVPACVLHGSVRSCWVRRSSARFSCFAPRALLPPSHSLTSGHCPHHHTRLHQRNVR